ncbi:MAG: hypothetical protein NVS9B1_19950 [Candidatus Dormibacteraceae bacterium]
MAKSASADDTVALLERTPLVLRELLGGLPESWVGEPDVAGGWTPSDVLGHLISAEMTNWIPRVETLLEHGTERPFSAFDRLAHVEREAGVPLAELIDRFGELRAKNLGRLHELLSGGAEPDRRGRHPDFGEVTLGQLLSAWAVHDLDHVQQVLAALAGSRDEAVGPWKPYLGILLRRDSP